jgi:dTDP-4-dehydrorhamnose reductase
VKQIGVIGSGGMLGHTICKVFDELEIEYLTFDRKPGSNQRQNYEYDISRDRPEKIFEILGPSSIAINCAGVITQKLNLGNTIDVLNAFRINSIFPRELNLAAERFGSRILQIGTDCIFSGNSGNYSESSLADPEDQYGITKYLGELGNSEGLILRTSLIGLEVDSIYGLLGWLLSHPRGSIIKGFTNHIWNGVTTLSAAKVISGIVSLPEIPIGKYHLVPQGELSKYQLLSIISNLIPKKEYTILPTEDQRNVNRTLQTDYAESNENFWKLGGYSVRPTHIELISEYLNWLEVRLDNLEGIDS